eukprot:4541960-Prymnesium_polylepis.1
MCIRDSSFVRLLLGKPGHGARHRHGCERHVRKRKGWRLSERARARRRLFRFAERTRTENLYQNVASYFRDFSATFVEKHPRSLAQKKKKKCDLGVGGVPRTPSDELS